MLFTVYLFPIVSGYGGKGQAGPYRRVMTELEEDPEVFDGFHERQDVSEAARDGCQVTRDQRWM